MASFILENDDTRLENGHHGLLGIQFAHASVGTINTIPHIAGCGGNPSSGERRATSISIIPSIVFLSKNNDRAEDEERRTAVLTPPIEPLFA